MDELYKEHILHHYRNPCNKYVLVDADVIGKEVNTLCGDEITVYAKIGTDGKIATMTFTGEGCAISMAAASLLTDYVYGKNPQKIAEFTQNNMEDLLGISVSTVRARCAMLPVQAFRNYSKCLK